MTRQQTTTAAETANPPRGLEDDDGAPRAVVQLARVGIGKDCEEAQVPGDAAVLHGVAEPRLDFADAKAQGVAVDALCAVDIDACPQPERRSLAGYPRSVTTWFPRPRRHHGTSVVHGRGNVPTAPWVTLHLANVALQTWIIWRGGAHRLSGTSWLHPTWGAERVKLCAWLALLGGSFWLVLGLIDPTIRSMWQG